MELESLKSRLSILMIASVVAWMFGILASAVSSNIPSLFPSDSYVTLVSISVFAFSFLFFGYPAPLIMFLAGIFAGLRVKTAGVDIYTIILSMICILAAYASIRLGGALLDDMVSKGNFKRALKISLIMTALFLIISIGVDLSNLSGG
jgi:uncharacterized membrane protein